MKIILTLLLAIPVFLSDSAASVLTGEYDIVVTADAIPAERNAARELQHFLRELSGLNLPIVNTATGKDILVGQSPEIARLVGGDFARLRPDEIIVKSTADGRLILSGARPRGTLYAVYTLLEEHYGVRFWTSWETDIPHLERLDISGLNLRYAPPFSRREVFWEDYNRHLEFAVRRRNYGDMQYLQVPPEWGGQSRIIGFVHTFDEIMPAEKYLATHPEFFSLVDGKRQGGQTRGQLCLTNPELLPVFIANVMKRLDENQDPQVISVSQNDNKNFCRCPNCTRSDARYGHSGTLLHFVNAVAAAVQEKYPGVTVETLAYQYTRTIPKENIRPRANVTIRLCSLECDFRKPLSDPLNASFGDDLRAWSKICPRLEVWNYAANFGDYLTPNPIITGYGPDLQFFAACRVSGVFEQGDYQSGGICGDLSALRGWLLSRLLWDPSQSQEKLLREFLDGYYGKAGKTIGEYLALLENEVRERRLVAKIWITARLSIPTVIRARQLMERAMAETRDDPVRQYRVRTAKIAIDMAFLERAPFIRMMPEYQSLLNNLEADGKELAAALEERKIKKVAESLPFAMIKPKILNMGKILNAPRPPEFAALPAGDYFDVQDSFMANWSPQESRKITDNGASDGLALTQANREMNWSFQYQIPEELLHNGLRWQVYGVVRCDKPAAGPGALVGYYDESTKRSISRYIPAAEIAGTTYKLMDIGTSDLSKGGTLYVGPVANPDSGNVYLDRVILVNRSSKAARPSQLARVPAENYLDIQHSFFTTHGGAVPVTVNDPSSSSGTVYQLKNEKMVWALQYQIPFAFIKPGATYGIYAAVRCDNRVKGNGILVGFYDEKTKKNIGEYVAADKIAGPTCRLIRIGQTQMSEDCLVYVGTVANPGSGNMYLDRLILVREQD